MGNHFPGNFYEIYFWKNGIGKMNWENSRPPVPYNIYNIYNFIQLLFHMIYILNSNFNLDAINTVLHCIYIFCTR